MSRWNGRKYKPKSTKLCMQLYDKILILSWFETSFTKWKIENVRIKQTKRREFSIFTQTQFQYTKSTSLLYFRPFLKFCVHSVFALIEVSSMCALWILFCNWPPITYYILKFWWLRWKTNMCIDSALLYSIHIYIIIKNTSFYTYHYLYT